ncbi:MAG TPA: hypothetical protein VEB22_11305 [Phycisphaerales bacterium]|nr:hypothetical protein [Phycisphaerales bacterium]
MTKRIVVGALLGVGGYALGRSLHAIKDGRSAKLVALEGAMGFAQVRDPRFWAAAGIGALTSWVLPKIGRY